MTQDPAEGSPSPPAQTETDLGEVRKGFAVLPAQDLQPQSPQQFDMENVPLGGLPPAGPPVDSAPAAPAPPPAEPISDSE
jgi:hypothetical protein